MTDEQRRARPATQYGPTAETVAFNVKRLRERTGMTIYKLSALLREAGRPITPAAVGKIERQQRQVNVDDLAALAVIFGVSPSALLLPLTPKASDPVEVTGSGTVSAGDAWSWADGERPLKVTEGNERKEMVEHQLYGRPQWLYERSPERLQAKREFFEQLAEWGAVDLDVVKRTDPAPWEES
ncbi:helix-turn-helix domain-containing protein [Streptomyces sp. AVP053U2]|uniref:helix-turn-helix domain-containing protein n=1 Tax=Streptomyces sp. AVP053U2 TaxID=1737066 RepID=UPI000782AA0F|nr:helix-turn-helix transcriptional regulator [Streptomyces sp. AVP053U2]